MERMDRLIALHAGLTLLIWIAHAILDLRPSIDPWPIALGAFRRNPSRDGKAVKSRKQSRFCESSQLFRHVTERSGKTGKNGNRRRPKPK